MPQLPIKKLANAFIPSASPQLDVGIAAYLTTKLIGRKLGGLWVGGAVEISKEVVSFAANGLNRDFHERMNEVHIATEDLVAVEYESGWFTGIVRVKHLDGEFRFRCYGAKALVAQMNELFIAKIV
ncbi:hypothetical protein DCO48_08140 [Pseudomonas sp. SDI]|uniref:hypothetical protein n=1 Tax=Pseudomonas sp. SDI TaxID=2170734 RepID=UPI000DE6A456|nr:hypothetical protein [Pseudomonas sp. SDI]PWB33939.1 hypothetical protein DCO48_08140 [Pseudomonas sp. SDI]